MEITAKKQSHILGREGEKWGKQSKHRQMHVQVGLHQLELQQGLKLQQDPKLHPLKLQLEAEAEEEAMMSLEVAQLQAEGEGMLSLEVAQLQEEAHKLGLWHILQLVVITEAYGGWSSAYGVAFWMLKLVCTSSY